MEGSGGPDQRDDLESIARDCDQCAGDAATEGDKGQARAWRAVAVRIRAISRTPSDLEKRVADLEAAVNSIDRRTIGQMVIG